METWLLATAGGLWGMLGAVVTVVFGLAMVYLAHELGHVLVAKVFRVKLARYYFGFDTTADPRNFAARPVWQRMIVVSAGMLMNLLLAVTFTAVAYRLGVSYTPCMIGGTAPGDPAWLLGLEPGDKILQIGRSGRPDEQLRFNRDLVPAVMFHGTATGMELLIRRRGRQEPEWISIQPSDRLQHLGRPATLGVRPPSTTRLADSWPPADQPWTDTDQQRLRAGDEIIAVNQVPLPPDESTGEILSPPLEAAFARHVAEPVTLTVLRRVEPVEDQTAPSVRRFDVVVPPTRMRVLGLAMQLGPVVGVRAGSPAEDAGFRAGDVLLSIDGEEVGDPLTLAQRLLPLIGERIEIEVQREDREQPVALRVEPQPPTAYAENFGPGSLLALESLGLALRVENVIQAVDPDGPAFQAGLRAGDEITEVWFLISDEAQRRPPMPPIELSDESPNWPYVHGILQAVAPGTEVEVTYRRRGETHVTQIAPVDSDVAFHAERGLAFAPLRQVRVADSWTESCGIGVHETGRAVGQVFAVLQRLITKRLAVGSLGGPITITAAGTAESSQGPPRLLLFLAFVSVNFAVLCCLPIPGLDGGHLLFLATEGIRRKPVPRKAQLLVSVICLGGLAFLFSLLVVPCLSQLLRLIGLFRTKNGSDSAPRISATSGAEPPTAP